MWKKSVLAAAAFCLANATADAHVIGDAIGALLDRTQVTSIPDANPRLRLSDSERDAFRMALASARAQDRARFDAAVSGLSNPDARRIAVWALVDASGDTLGFSELNSAWRELKGWPRETRRRELTEKAIETSALGPQQIIEWFGGGAPETAEGAMALANAFQTVGREREADELIRDFWRNKVFEADVQRRMLARFGGVLTTDDHIRRADILLYGAQGPAARDMLALLSESDRKTAEMRITLRAGRDVNPGSLAGKPGLAFERISQLRRAGKTSQALALTDALGPAPGWDDADARIYSERRQLFVAALQAQDYRAAYNAMNNGGFNGGERQAEAEFFAGWIALTKLNDPARAAGHFEGVRTAGRTPITQGRALYWLGRAAEAMGDQTAAGAYYAEGGKHIGAFYGQLAAEKAGITEITLPSEPMPTADERAAFENRDLIRAMRILSECGETDLFRSFLQFVDDDLPTATDYALLMDMARDNGEAFLAMMTGRAAAGRGFILPERMYPIRTPPDVAGAPEPAFVLAITRQESSFDPGIRSSADARGMMMLLPSTARLVARRLGVSYEASQLWDAEYNMRLGTFHLGELISDQSGSYLLTAVGYNAGPSRAPQWTAYCGDPRGATTDPLDFIECAPFTETRNYMMRVMENVQVYRARLNGGTAPLTPSADLKRGGWSYQAAG